MSARLVCRWCEYSDHEHCAGDCFCECLDTLPVGYLKGPDGQWRRTDAS